VRFIDEHAVGWQLTGASAMEYHYLLKKIHRVADRARAMSALVENAKEGRGSRLPVAVEAANRYGMSW